MIDERTGDLNRLASGANLLADNLGDVRGQVSRAVAGVRSLVDALAYIQNQFGGNKHSTKSTTLQGLSAISTRSVTLCR